MVSELPVSIDTPEEQSAFTIIPNPNTGTFQIKSANNGRYKILNTAGQIIQRGELVQGKIIDISHATQGVYFISIETTNKVEVKRVVKM